ncbi:MAG TPA: desulfoferrodoxin [Firmicutes bacterium]|nr:desulfoferrodoxin [Bacillota bacterium]
MTELRQVYKCNICGNIVEVVHTGAGTLVCCGQPMELMAPQTADSAYEKHVPVIEAAPEGTRVRVGSVDHPMIDEHWIEWIEVVADGKVYREYLKPGQPPVAVFCAPFEKVTEAREYCNLHGLWIAKKE